MSDDLLERLGRGCNCGRCKLDLCCCAAMEEAKVEIEKLREALREVFEEWAGSEGFIPETAPEGYLLHLTKRMADIARAALGETKIVEHF